MQFETSGNFSTGRKWYLDVDNRGLCVQERTGDLDHWLQWTPEARTGVWEALTPDEQRELGDLVRMTADLRDAVRALGYAYGAEWMEAQLGARPWPELSFAAWRRAVGEAAPGFLSPDDRMEMGVSLFGAGAFETLGRCAIRAEGWLWPLFCLCAVEAAWGRFARYLSVSAAEGLLF